MDRGMDGWMERASLMLHFEPVYRKICGLRFSLYTHVIFICAHFQKQGAVATYFGLNWKNALSHVPPLLQSLPVPSALCVKMASVNAAFIICQQKQPQ